MEEFLARLLTDAAFRRQFLADPAGMAEQEGLSAEQSAALAAMSMPDLTTAAWSFECKRNAKRRGGTRSWVRRLIGRA